MIAELTAVRDEIARSERRRGVLEERQRLARDVHDTLAQALTSIGVQLGAARAAADDRTRELYVERALAATRDGLAQARRVVWDLGDDEVDALDEGVARLTAGLNRHSDITVTSLVTGTPVPVPHQSVRNCGNITREALTNIGRHADAARASVTVSYLDDAVCLDVCDDGRGMDGRSDARGVRTAQHATASGATRRDDHDRVGTRTRHDRGGVGAAAMTASIRVCIVDDHPVVRDGLRGMLAGADNIEVVADAGDGADAVLAVQRHRPSVVLMDLRMPRLDGVTAIASRVVDRARGGRTDQLTDREIEVLRLVADGRSNRAVARTLAISEATVKTHLIHIFRKLDVADRTSAVTRALERRIIRLDRARIRSVLSPSPRVWVLR